MAPSFLLLLLLSGILAKYFDGVDAKRLSFVEIPPDKVTFVRGDQDYKCQKLPNVLSIHLPLNCQVNQRANYTWQECHSFTGDVSSDKNFLTCEEMFAEEEKYCRNVSRRYNKGFSVVTIGKLVGKRHVAQEGCFRCIARAGNQEMHVSGTYNYKDQCGTPTRYDSINPLRRCHRKDFFCQSKINKCKLLEPEDMQVAQQLTAEGKFDFVLQWKEPFNNNGIYGYKIQFIDDTGYPHCRHIITLYNRTRWFKGGKYHFSIKDNIGDSPCRPRTPYVFKLQSLPSSKELVKTVEINFPELCNNYTEANKVTPTKCLMVKDIHIASACNIRSPVTLAWNTSGLPSTVKRIILWYFHRYREKIILSPNVSSYTFVNVSTSSKVPKVLIQLVVGRVHTYCSRVIPLTCKFDPTVSPPHQIEDYTQTILYVVFPLCVIFLLAFFGFNVFRIQKLTRLPHFPYFQITYVRVPSYYRQMSTTSSTVEEEEKEERAVVFLDARSSSVYEDNKEDYGPLLAWTGGSMICKGFFQSKEENNPWLQIRIKSTKISGITIINRADAHGNRLKNIKVRAGRNSEPLANDVVGTFDGCGVDGEKYYIQFSRTVMTDYITIQLEGNGILHINGIRAQAVTKVMLVYPEGCLEVEKLVVYISKLLTEVCIDVLVDLCQAERIHDNGLLSTLNEDFCEADYIVVLCVEPQNTQDQKPKAYEYLRDNCILPEIKEQGNKRFIAISSANKYRHSDDLIPIYLKEKSYFLSSDLEYFLQHVVDGIQTTSSSTILREAARRQIKEIDQYKNNIQTIDDSINAECHSRCYLGTCCKGVHNEHGSCRSEDESANEMNERWSSSLSIEVSMPENKCDEHNSKTRLLYEA